LSVTDTPASVPPIPPPPPTNRRVGASTRRLAASPIPSPGLNRRTGLADRRVAAPLAGAPAEGTPVNPNHVFVNGILAATSIGALSTGKDDPAVAKFIADTTALMAKAKAALKTVLDAVLSGAAVDVVTLEADVVPIAEAYIENHTSPAVGNAVKAFVGIATPIVSPFEYAINAKLFAGIADLRDHLGV